MRNPLTHTEAEPGRRLRCFTLGAVGASVSVRSPRLDRMVADAFDRLGFEASASKDGDLIRMDVGVRREPPRLPTQALPVGGADDVKLHREGGTHYLSTPAWTARLDGRHRRAQIVLGPPGGRRPEIVFSAVSRVLLAMLRYGGHHTLHAACVVPPQVGPLRGGVLMVAPSGSGKSTLAAGLVQSGWRYVGDDLVLLSALDDGVTATGLVRDFGLCADAAEAIPEARRHARRRTARKFDVDIRSLFPDRFVPRCRPSVVVFPEIVEATESTLEPLEESTAVAFLARQMNVVAAMEPDVVSAQLDLCGRLAAQCECVRLRAGRDLAPRPAALAHLLDVSAGICP